MASTITIVTHEGAPGGVADDHILRAAISRLGGDARCAAWTDPTVDWAAGSVTVVRSTWDYHLRPEAWLRWLDRVEPVTRIVNPPRLVRWNGEKTYLLDLASHGVPVVPTVLVEDALHLTRACDERGWTDVVVKPAVGASAHGARRFCGAEIVSRGAAHATRLLSSGKVLLQPYQRAVEGARERSLVYVDGAFCHAFSKPGFHAGLGDEDLPRHTPTADEERLGQAALAALPTASTFARIDVVPSPDGPLLMEAELIEPQLALHLCDDTARKLARSLTALAGTARAPCPAVGPAWSRPSG